MFQSVQTVQLSCGPVPAVMWRPRDPHASTAGHLRSRADCALQWLLQPGWFFLQEERVFRKAHHWVSSLMSFSISFSFFFLLLIMWIRTLFFFFCLSHHNVKRIGKTYMINELKPHVALWWCSIHRWEPLELLVEIDNAITVMYLCNCRVQTIKLSPLLIGLPAAASIGPECYVTAADLNWLTCWPAHVTRTLLRTGPFLQVFHAGDLWSGSRRGGLPPLCSLV